MNGNGAQRFVECLCTGDPRVSVLMGRQRPPAPGEGVRKSRFAFSLYAGGTYLLFHTLTRRLLEVSPEFIDYFADDRVFPASVLAEAFPEKLYENHFLVPESAEESRIYLELKHILTLKEELPDTITNYVILPTTTCNARCFYCFEQGMRYQKMQPDTVEHTLRFIRDHKPRGDRKIHIHWFGGEPMCATGNIDRICEGLNEARIGFTAEMTSNGSLFTEASARKAAEAWKVSQIQITLDGMAEEYARRKHYTNTIREPFKTVIGNMHTLIAAGIGVTVRLNVDENNLGEIFRVVDYVNKEFVGKERERLRVYAHSIFAPTADGPDSCPSGTGSDALEARVVEINDYVRRQGLMVVDLGELFTLKTHYCKVTAPKSNVLIDACGQLFACDAMPEDMRYGDVKTGIDPAAWKRVAAPCDVRDECKACAFLPQCTEFDRCPNRMAFDGCRRQEQRKLDIQLRVAHDIYRRQKRQEEQAEQRKAVSDVSY